MKKKILICLALLVGVLTLTACAKTNINLADYLIEERYNLFTAEDNLYCATLSTGMRETDYNMDGVKTELIPFGVLTLKRKDNGPMANDTYNYRVTIGENAYTGTMEKSFDNSYTVDIGTNTDGQENINVVITFTGYTFNRELQNTSSEFSVDKTTALEIANKELKENLKQLGKDKNTGIEVVMKIVNDYSSAEIKNYYWYIGVVTTNADTLGVLIDAKTGEIIAKKV